MRIILLLLLITHISFSKKVALVIGNSDYEKSFLTNPINDATLIGNTLENELGFKVTYAQNLTKYEMENAIKKFAKEIKKDDIALFFYSGHGMQYQQLNYLIPLKAEPVTEAQIPYVGVNVNYILGGMERAKLAVLLLDSCRDNPFRSFTRSRNKGLAQTKSHQRNYIISYATEAGGISKDGDGKNSPYALALNSLLTRPIEVTSLFQELRNKVARDTKFAQVPYYDIHFIGNFKLNEKCTDVIEVPATYKITHHKEKVSDSYIIYEWMENGVKHKLKPKFKNVKITTQISKGGYSMTKQQINI